MEKEKITKVLYNQVSLLIAIVGVVVGVMGWVRDPQAKLNDRILVLETQIESNKTVTAALQAIKDNDLHEVQLRMDRIESRQVEELQAIARLEALLTKNNR